MVLAQSVKVGEQLVGADGGNLTVLSIDHVDMAVLHNPQTMHGDIVVDKALVSTYTHGVRPTAAHALLSSFRALTQL